jgi:hypothetical protein
MGEKPQMFEALFGAQMPLAVKFVLALIIVLVIIPLVVTLILHVIRLVFPRKSRTIPNTRISGNWSVRRALIVVAEIVVLLMVVIMTVSCALFGAELARMMASNPAMGGGNVDQMRTVGTIVGGIAGFVLSALLTAFFFTLTEIERNTRHTAAMLDRLVSHLQR